MGLIERIIYPTEVLREYKDKLINLYVEDYGKKHKKLIEKRLNDTLYFFETTPDKTFEFFLKYAPYHHDIEEVAIEALDYTEQKEKLSKNVIDKLFEIYCVAFNVKPSMVSKLLENKEEFITLPIHAFSSSSNQHQDLNLQQTYIEKVSNLGIPLLTDESVIDCLLQLKQKYYDKHSIDLIEKTIWGQRIWHELSEAMAMPLDSSLVAVAEIVETKCSNIKINDNKNRFVKNIIHFPIIDLYSKVVLDDNFLHETRHAVEMGENGTGFDLFNNSYKIFNELRVEKHAMDDSKRIETIFSKNQPDTKHIQAYRLLLPSTIDFLNSSESYLDSLAITQNIKCLEKTYGQDDIKTYAEILNRRYDEIFNYLIYPPAEEYVIENDDIYHYTKKFQQVSKK